MQSGVLVTVGVTGQAGLIAGSTLVLRTMQSACTHALTKSGQKDVDPVVNVKQLLIGVGVNTGIVEMLFTRVGVGRQDVDAVMVWS
jgi:hypothetical protein